MYKILKIATVKKAFYHPSVFIDLVHAERQSLNISTSACHTNNKIKDTYAQLEKFSKSNSQADLHAGV